MRVCGIESVATSRISYRAKNLNLLNAQGIFKTGRMLIKNVELLLRGCVNNSLPARLGRLFFGRKSRNMEEINFPARDTGVRSFK